MRHFVNLVKIVVLVPAACASPGATTLGSATMADVNDAAGGSESGDSGSHPFPLVAGSLPACTKDFPKGTAVSFDEGAILNSGLDAWFSSHYVEAGFVDDDHELDLVVAEGENCQRA